MQIAPIFGSSRIVHNASTKFEVSLPYQCIFRGTILRINCSECISLMVDERIFRNNKYSAILSFSLCFAEELLIVIPCVALFFIFLIFSFPSDFFPCFFFKKSNLILTLMLNAGRIFLDVVGDSKGDGRSYLIALGLGVVSVLLTVLTLESDLVLYNVCFLIFIFYLRLLRLLEMFQSSGMLTFMTIFINNNRI